VFGISLYELLLFLHILAAISFLGPVTVATSLFPQHANLDDVRIARVCARISRGYGFASLAVPLFGIWTAQEVNYLDAAWVHASIGLFALAWLALVAFIVPQQAKALRQLEAGETPTDAQLGPLRGVSGLYSLSWLVILIFMVAKPF
jgi:uncharacterized membrane protein